MRSSILLSALFLLACNHKPALVAKPASATPLAAVASGAGQAASMTVAGKVLERIDAGAYSYLRLDTLGGEQWAAVPKCELKNGAAAVVSHAMPMDGFESKTLNRKFEHIVFGILDSPGAAAAVPAAAGAPAPSPHGQMAEPHGGESHGGLPHGGIRPASAPPADIGPIAVARATGPAAATVAEVFAKKASLDNKPVRVHAKVVKVLPGIMGKNWLHVRDGSGSADKNDNDLTVTTQDVATVGSVVLVEGTVHADKDFGSGYKFSAIVEDAKVTK
jgi:hypothetical protein